MCVQGWGHFGGAAELSAAASLTGGGDGGLALKGDAETEAEPRDVEAFIGWCESRCGPNDAAWVVARDEGVNRALVRRWRDENNLKRPRLSPLLLLPAPPPLAAQVMAGPEAQLGVATKARRALRTKVKAHRWLRRRGVDADFGVVQVSALLILVYRR
jgi:hypothetical protein